MFGQVTLLGNVGSDAEMRYTPAGKAVASFSLAVSRGYGENKKTIWYRISMWDKLAESMTEHILKGKMLLIIGNMDEPNVYQDKKSNEWKASLQVTAREIHFAGGNKDGASANGGGGHTAVSTEMHDEDIPF